MRNDARAKDKQFNMTLGVNARYFRERAALTNKQVAEGVSYGEAWVSNLENYKNKKRISEEDVDRLAQVLGVPAIYLTSSDPEIDHLLASIDDLIRERKYDEAASQADRLTQLVKAEHGPRYQAMALVKRGNIDFHQERYSESLALYRSAYRIADENRDIKMHHDTLQNILNSHMQLHEFDLAEKLALRGFEDGEGMQKAKYCLLLARIYVQQEKWERAERWIFEAIGYGEQNAASEIYLMACYQLLGVVCINFDDRLHDAVTASELVLDLAKRNQHTLGIVYGLIIEGEALLSLGQPVAAKNVLRNAMSFTPNDRQTEKLEIEFLMLCCEDTTLDSYRNMQSLLSRLERTSIALRVLARMYIKAAKAAGQLKLIDDVMHYYDMAFQIRASIVR